ncbi:hypothetical protein [Azospirillum soli]|uniref:hypothetical protein n=1 Tax=Azospirillum soli TaxID=1304799 RepID=UPI001AE79071|nr:hypothetical protein [Azospirillum soli]MBP2310856.1 hypothetical protein [Azospirillum soli]
MRTTTTLPHDPATDAHASVLERPDGLERGVKFPEPVVEKMRGPKLIALWVGLAAGAWGITAGVGYGFYVVVQSVLP